MRKAKLMLFVPMAVAAMACGRNGSSTADDALKNDLALASQAQPYNPQQFVSPTEAGLAAQPMYAQPYAPRTVQTAVRQPVRRASTARRSSGSSSSGAYYPAEPRTTVSKHTNRDAAIGAAAGAVIGATTSRDKIKGGLIGAAAGAILGGVIGNNVDIQRRTTP